MHARSVKPSPPTDLIQCYWVLPGQLLAGEYPGHVERGDAPARLDALLEAGIDTFVDLTEPQELSSYEALLHQLAEARGIQVVHQRFPIVDFGLPTIPQMSGILDFLDRVLAEKRRVYVHCWGGVGRTGVTVGCFLARHGRTPAEALDQIAAWWVSMPKRRFHPQSPETREQVQFVLEWPEGRKTGNT